MLNTRELQLVARQREVENAEAKVIAKAQELIAREQDLSAREQNMKHYLEERTHEIREQLNIEIRKEWNEWRVKAEIEMMQQAEQVKLSLESQFEFAVSQRVEAQMHQRVEAHLFSELELKRRIMELNSLHSEHSSSTSSQLSARTGITSMSSSFHSPTKHSPPQLSAPDSPADVDMRSPSRDQSPLKQDNTFHNLPAINLHQSLLQRSHRSFDPNPHGNASMEGPFGGSEDGEGDDSSPQNTTPQQSHMVAPTGSPIKRGDNGRIQTTTDVNPFCSSSNTAIDTDELKMAAAAKSFSQKENQRSVTESAKLRKGVAPWKNSVANWDEAKAEDMPSPYKKLKNTN